MVGGATPSRRMFVLFGPALFVLAACKVVPIAADREIRARRSGTLDPNAYVDQIWTSRVVPQLQSSATPLDQLRPGLAADIDKAGAAHGRRAADSAPWTFVAKGSGQIVTIDRRSPAGSITLATGDGGLVTLQTGPVIVDSAIRDALPFIAFNDFADQIAFAGVGAALTRRALRDNAAVLGNLAVGDHVTFLGVFNLADGSEPIRMTPVAVQRAGRTAG